MSKKSSDSTERAQISPPMIQSAGLPTPGESYITSPTSPQIQTRKRETVANFHRSGDQLPQSGMTGGLNRSESNMITQINIFFQLLIFPQILAVTNS